MTHSELMVLEDQFEERGLRRIPKPSSEYEWTVGVPQSWDKEIGIARVSVYWFGNYGHGNDLSSSRVEVNLTWDSSRTRMKVPREIQQNRLGMVRANITNVLEAVDAAIGMAKKLNANVVPDDPTVPRGMSMPDGLSLSGKLAWQTFVKFFVQHGLKYTGGGTTFYSPEEWEARREPYSQGGVLVVTYDGGEPREAMTGEDEGLYEQMQEALNAQGFYFEAGTSWSGGVYRLES
jgi:hypothetical protein